MALTYAQIEGLWVQAGGSQDTAPLAAAIAMAESGGNPNSVNNNAHTGDLSYGLWQINMIGQLGPSREKQFGITNYSQLLDPLTNAKAAVAVSSGGKDFTPWTTFTHGAYKQYMQGNVPPDLNAGGAGGPSAQLASDPISGAITSVEQWADGLFNYFFFGLLVASGLVLMLAGTLGMTIGVGPLKPAPATEGDKVLFKKTTEKTRVSVAPSKPETRQPRNYRVKNEKARTAKIPVQKTRAIGTSKASGTGNSSRQAPKRVTAERMDRKEVTA